MRKTKAAIRPRVPMPEQPAGERRANFEEVALGYSLDQAMEEASRCLQCKKPLCQKGCPVEVDIKGFVARLAFGDVTAAYRIIKETNSLPAVCGRVCPQEIQCEGACVLSKKGEAIAIGRLERFAADAFAAGSACEEMTGKPECPPVRGDLKAACIGSGPSSLTVAGYLSARGVKVTVFEALHEPGGVLTYGIPKFRLPKRVVKREVDALKERGVDIVPNWVGGKTFTIEELFQEGHQAVFVGVGAGLPRFLGIPGETLTGVFSANEYLTRINLGRAWAFPDHDTPTYRCRRVTVIGGGNVAMDAARTALRLGAEKVTIVYRRARDEMPARLEELHHAIEEGVELACLLGPVAFNGDERGSLKSLTAQKMAPGEPDAAGRRRPCAIEGEVVEIETDMCVVAVGAGPNPVLLSATPELSVNKRGYVVINEETGETSMDNVFAGGDIVTGSATVILAMGAGRRAAREIARRLGVEA